jgi:uncharacterized LabA/DUF88 family protein
MYFHPRERIGLFLDGLHLHATAKALGFNIDYKRLIASFRQSGRLVRAHYYLAFIEDHGDLVRRFASWLCYNEFTVVTKAAKEYPDGMGGRKIKTSVDVELTVDALSLAPNLDHIVLFAGNSDYARLAAALQKKGRRVSVISTIQSSPAMLSDELRRQADQFIDLVDLRPLIGREQKSNNKVHAAHDDSFRGSIVL